MAFIEIVPRYRGLLTGCGRSSARTLLDWSGVIVSGHPRRHVLRVQVGAESFILKKEHRVPWRDRLASAWSGFGWSSKSVREARLLSQLRAAGVPCPELVAVGEDGSQAFVLLREQTGMTELRAVLTRLDSAAEGRALASALGRELARIHAAGFTQPDLYAKHILARRSRGGFEFCFLDWQRSRPLHRVSWRRRVRDLAALDASLAVELAPDRLRLACLRAYLRDTRAHGVTPDIAVRSLAIAIRRRGERRLLRRQTRELRQPPLAGGAQELLWLQDGERLCIARDFYEELGGQLPSWLPQDPGPSPDGAYTEHRLIMLGSGRTGHLVQRWSGAVTWLYRGKFPAPELARAAAIFRLQRFGVAGPRLLAMGHRQVTAWQRFSFLLTEPPTGPSLGTVLRQGGTPGLRQRLLREFGAQLRQIHEAGYALRPDVDMGQAWVVSATLGLALASVQPLERTHASWQVLAVGQASGLPLFAGRTPAPRAHELPLSRADRLRVLLGYLRLRRLDAVRGNGWPRPSRAKGGWRNALALAAVAGRDKAPARARGLGGARRRGLAGPCHAVGRHRRFSRETGPFHRPAAPRT